jgi:acetylornithine deacetylase/succinyl-diaminopimelate desuccinylase-like protein
MGDRLRARILAGLLATACVSGRAHAQKQVETLRSQIDSYVRANQKAIVREFVQLLSIPNVASDRNNIRKNAALLREMFERRGFRSEVLETSGNPLVWAELRVPGARRTLLFYAHYDGQPVNPPEWRQASPFTPILRAGRLEDGASDLGDPSARNSFEPNDRIYARSASDDKAPIIAMLASIDALKSIGRRPSSNIRIILDGEEEAGSPSLVPAIGKYREKLTADAMMIFDGPVHPSGRPTIVYGARGALAIQLTVFGPKVALHSGHYGNWVPNPAARLAELLATLKDKDGKVLVEGFYDGIPKLTSDERKMLDAVPDDPESLKKLFGIAAPERAELSLQDALQLPSLNVRGLSSGFVGEQARTIIPARAVAEIDVRLIKETPANRKLEQILAHIRKQGWHIVDADPDDRTRAKFDRIVKVTSRGEGTNAFRTSAFLPMSRQLVTTMTRMFGAPPVEIRTMGGTVPIVPFIEALNFPAFVVPSVNFDNNQHAENENIKLEYLFQGITTVVAVLTM